MKNKSEFGVKGATESISKRDRADEGSVVGKNHTSREPWL